MLSGITRRSDTDTSGVVETETWLKFRDLFKNTETRDFKICAFCRSVFKNVIITSDFIFFKFLAFFGRFLVVYYLQIQQTKNR